MTRFERIRSALGELRIWWSTFWLVQRFEFGRRRYEHHWGEVDGQQACLFCSCPRNRRTEFGHCESSPFHSNRARTWS